MNDGSISAHPMVERVRAALAAARVETRIVELSAAARTARAAAEQIGCEVAQIANSLVFRCARSDAPLLVMASGAQRVDLARVAALVGEEVGKADAAFVRAATGFTIGGVAPLGHAEALPTALDPSLARFPRIYAAAGHPHCVFATTFDELVLLTGGRADAGLAA